MIVVDTSAIISIFLGESDADIFADQLRWKRSLISAASYVELWIVLKARIDVFHQKELLQFLRRADCSIVNVTPEQAQIAADARFQYPVLNYGDTFSYALAKDKGLPLLYKGDDFAKTDIQSAL